MNHAEEIKKLEETRNAVTSFISELDARLERKEVNGIEYHLIISEKLCGQTKDEVLKKMDSKIKELKEKEKAEEEWQKRKTIVTVSVTAMIIIILAIAGILYTSPGGVTGYVIVNTHTLDKTYTQYTEETLNMTNITGLKISGTLEGTGAKIYLRTESGDYIVAELNNTQEKNITTNYTLRTDKNTYAIGENVNIIINPPTTNASLYILYAEENNILSANTYTPDHEDNYTVRALIVTSNDIIRLETTFAALNETTNETEQQDNTVSQETIETTTEPATTMTFKDLCTQTCTLTETNNPTLIITTEEESKLTITTITTNEQQENHAPIQTKSLPDLTLNKNQEWTIEMNDYFTDPDSESLTYDIGTAEGLETQITSNMLTFSSATEGTYETYVYATDGKEMITSNTFLITITEEEYTEGNVTTNETTPEENETNETGNNESELPIADTTNPCNNPDINLRPSVCFVGLESQAFEELTVELQDKNRARIGMFTRYGNLVIRGLLIESAQGEPAANDFQIGFSETQGFAQTKTNTAWISTESGNLNLRGNIYENQETLEPSQFNTFIIRNKYDVILGYFDEKTGDLYLRGNIVQLGKI